MSTKLKCIMWTEKWITRLRSFRLYVKTIISCLGYSDHNFSLHGTRSCRCKHPMNKTSGMFVKYD